MRGDIAPGNLPVSGTRASRFDDLVLDAVAELDHRWSQELAGIDFGVEVVPSIPAAASVPPGELPQWNEDVLEDNGIPLAQVLRDAAAVDPPRPTIVVYRRPLETRAIDEEDLADLVFEVVLDRLAYVLGKDPDELDPPH